MSNVIVDKNKIDILANAISCKSGEPVTMTLDEMVSAVDGIDTSGGGGTPTLETITKTYTPSTSAVTDTITASAGYDGIEEVDVTVSAVPSAEFLTGVDHEFYTENNVRKWHFRGKTELDTGEGDVEGWISEGTYYGEYATRNAIATGTSVTPTESAQTIGGSSYMMEGAVTVNAIPSNYVGSGITRRNDNDLTVNGAYFTAPNGYYENSATSQVTLGSEGTPTATKGSVSNHSISVTPSVTNTEGYISGGTHTGTAVSVSASELVSGSQTLSDNGDYDVTNLASVTVSVSGGGGGNLTVATATKTLTSAASTISFTGLSGNPTSFVVTSSSDQSTGGTKAVAVAYDGTGVFGMDITTQMEADTGFSKSYSSGTLTITATSATFEANEYKLVYTYGGSSSDIHTADVQVGSGATSITFSSLSGKPAYFSCVFKSTFSTSSGYQRVIDVVNDGTNTYGHAMDSSAKAQTSWSYSYSGGSLTITSTGTNNGGYFHQPGYYQLTYAVDSNEPQYESVSKTYRASASAQSETITPSSGYDAIEEVSISIPAVSQTNLTAENIKSGTTISISNGQSNLWSVTGSYTGGGGGTLTVATKTTTLTATSQTLTFSSLSGQPKYWFLRATTNVSSSGSTTYYYVTDCFFDGTNIKGNTFRIGSTRRVQNITSGISQSYSGGTLTITAGSSSGATPGQFYGTSSFGYELVYIY